MPSERGGVIFLWKNRNFETLILRYAEMIYPRQMIFISCSDRSNMRKNSILGNLRMWVTNCTDF
jgi:hypothetical protein